jgi:hypothetical protein
MTSYCDIKDAYSNNDALDKLARNFNNKKQLVKQVRQDYKKDKQILKKNVEQLKKLAGYDFCSRDENYSQYTDNTFDSGSSVSLNSPSEHTIVMKNSDVEDSDFSSYSSQSSKSSNFEPTSKSTGQDYSINVDKINRVLNGKIKNKKYLFDECMSCDSISQDSVTSDDDIINHASKCSKCKRKIMKILHNKKKPKKHINENDYSNKTAEIITKSSASNLKEFIIICGIGLLIIFLLDFVMRVSRNS